MPESPFRSTAAIDADLHALSATRRDAQRELAEVRRRQRELADLEAELVVAIDVRSGHIDDVLDECLRASPRLRHSSALSRSSSARHSPASDESQVRPASGARAPGPSRPDFPCVRSDDLVPSPCRRPGAPAPPRPPSCATALISSSSPGSCA